MFAHEGVTLRSLEEGDLEDLYRWSQDQEIEILSGWGPRLSRLAFMQKWGDRLTHPSENLQFFGIESQGILVGRLDLAKIDREQQTAYVGFFIGDRPSWGKGIAGRALQIALDYAFMVENLYRIGAETYRFNTRSQHLLEKVGFQQEGILRQAECHNGERQDMVQYGILKPEFFLRHTTRFAIPG